MWTSPQSIFNQVYQHIKSKFITYFDLYVGTDIVYLQMYYTCMINKVTTPAPVLWKLLANQFFSFPKQP